MTSKAKKKSLVVCGWVRESEDSDTWATGCGEYFTLNEGTPKENKMEFCCFCGNTIEEL
jgi:hypothetical protein